MLQGERDRDSSTFHMLSTEGCNNSTLCTELVCTVNQPCTQCWGIPFSLQPASSGATHLIYFIVLPLALPLALLLALIVF